MSKIAHLKLPGEANFATGFFRKEWYEYRLGMLKADGELSSSGEKVLVAYVHYLKTLFHPVSRRRHLAFQPVQKNAAGRKWTGVYRTYSARLKTGEIKEGPLQGLISEKVHVQLMANFWRARIWARGGRAALFDVLRNSPDVIKKYPEIVPLLTGSSNVKVAPDSLRLPRKVTNKLRVGTGVDSLSYIVVDVDNKPPDVPGEEFNSELFEALMCLFTKAKGFLRPGLIVTSQSGEGCHLYIFMKYPTPPYVYGKPYEKPAKEPSKILRARLCELLGVPRLPRQIDILPPGYSDRMQSTYLPFSPGSYLCDATGKVVAKDPVQCLLKWREQTNASPVIRYGIADLEKAEFGKVPAPVLAKAKALVQQAVVDQTPKSATGTGHSATLETLLDAENLYDEGGRGGQTFDDLPVMVRWAKFHLDLDLGSTQHLLMHWLDKGNGWNNETEQYEAQIKSLYEHATNRLKEPTVIYRLSPEDPISIAEAVLKLPKYQAVNRRALVQTMLGFTAVARSKWPVGTSEEEEVVIHVGRKIGRTWHRDYAKVTTRLVRKGWLGRSKQYQYGAGFTNKTQSYEITLQPGGEPERFDDPKALWRYFVARLQSKSWIGKELAGARNWKNWCAQVGL